MNSRIREGDDKSLAPSCGLQARKARTNALILGITTGLASRVLTLGAPLLTIPVTLHYLGPDLFGFWMVIVSITSMAMFADLGLGNGLLSKLSAAHSAEDYIEAKVLISTAYAVLSTVAAFLITALFVAAQHVDLRSIDWISRQLDIETVRTVAVICLAAFCLNIPMSLIQRVQYALQEGWKSNVWQVVAAAATVAAVYSAWYLNLGYIAVVSASVFSTPVVMLLNNLWFFWKRPELRPVLQHASLKTANSLLRIGGAFLILSVLTSLSLNVDNLVVAELSGLANVAEFTIATKLYSLLGLAITLVALPLWPANADALARRDITWVKRTTLKTSALSVAAVAVGGLVLILSRGHIINLWIGDGVLIELSLAINLVIWSVLVALASPFFAVQNSVGHLRIQLAGWTVYFFVSVPLKVILYGEFGIAGVPLAGWLAYLIVLIPCAIFGCRMTIKRIANKSGV